MSKIIYTTDITTKIAHIDAAIETVRQIGLDVINADVALLNGVDSELFCNLRSKTSFCSNSMYHIFTDLLDAKEKLIDIKNAFETADAELKKKCEGWTEGIPIVVVNNDSEIPDRPSLEITPHLSNYEGNRSADAYNEVLADLNVENRQRYQRTSTATWCNIYVWDATKAMGCEIPHYYNRVTGAPLSRDYCLQHPGEYYEMSAIRMTNWLCDHGSEYGWVECTAEEAIAHANMGQPTVCAATTTGHVAMVAPQGDGESGVMISQAGASNFQHGPQSNGFGNYPVKYFYHL